MKNKKIMIIICVCVFLVGLAFGLIISLKNNDKEKENNSVDTFTAIFDTNGGSEVKNITFKKGETLTLPENPTKENYTFIRWEDKHGTPIYNEALIDGDITLYAVWEESVIGLSITNKVIHPNSKNTFTEAKVLMENKNDISYSLSDNKCVSVDNNGKVTFNNLNENDKKECFENGKKVSLTASTPSGNAETVEFEIEKTLVLTIGEILLQNNGTMSWGNEFNIKSNMNVSWNASIKSGGTKYTGEKSNTSTNFVGTYDCKTTENTTCPYVTITATTPSGQIFKTEMFGG